MTKKKRILRSTEKQKEQKEQKNEKEEPDHLDLKNFWKSIITKRTQNMSHSEQKHQTKKPAAKIQSTLL